MEKRNTGIRIPGYLLDWLDDEAEKRFQTRSGFLATIISRAKEEAEHEGLEDGNSN